MGSKVITVTHIMHCSVYLFKKTSQPNLLAFCQLSFDKLGRRHQVIEQRETAMAVGIFHRSLKILKVGGATH